ncbi:MAG: peptide-methionine (S)-S-oxide reductase MsrA [Corynebacterium sp.]|nr:peptide-methionine (S)-S-oxide reductase MsrA [Corynebacterium sp.]
MSDFLSRFSRATPELVPAQRTLPGRAEPIVDAPAPHAVKQTPITGPWIEGQKSLLVGIGCFWGAEKLFWERAGVQSTSVGYAGGHTPNPTYYEVCSGLTNHAEVVEVVYDPQQVSLEELVVLALEAHDPTQGFRQGNDIGTQYRSAFYVREQGEKEVIAKLVDAYSSTLADHGFGPITTEVELLSETPAGEYYRAEESHQQYLAKNPGGYCPHHSTGIKCS